MIDLNNLNLHAVISETGINAPTYPEILDRLKTFFKMIYGQDIYIEPDSKDGELLAIFAKAIFDANANAIDIYHSFSPSRASGDALSANVKINGIARKLSSFSQCDVVITGAKGTIINFGAVRDQNNILWDLPNQVIIGLDESITVTATCRIVGATIALANTITEIATPTRGWFSVNNPNGATIGQPVETDAQLRRRQTLSVALPSQTVLNGITGAIANLSGVTRYRNYENDTAQTDKNGLPPHSISLVVDGGDAQAIGDTIALKKTPGCNTYGTTKVKHTDKYGLQHTISFFRPEIIFVYVTIKIRALAGYNNKIGDQLKQAIVNYIDKIGIGENILHSKLYLPANLACSQVSNVYDVTEILIGTTKQLTASNIKINFNQAPHCELDFVRLEVE